MYWPGKDAPAHQSHEKKARIAPNSPPSQQAALDAVVRESFQLYKALSEGVINLADAYFSMPYLQAGGVPVVDLRCGLLRVVVGNRFAGGRWVGGSEPAPARAASLSQRWPSMTPLRDPSQLKT